MAHGTFDRHFVHFYRKMLNTSLSRVKTTRFTNLMKVSDYLKLDAKINWQFSPRKIKSQNSLRPKGSTHFSAEKEWKKKKMLLLKNPLVVSGLHFSNLSG